MNSDGCIHNTNWYVCYSYLNRCGRDAARIHLRAKSVSCRHGDYFIDLLGNGFAVTLAVGGARLAPPMVSGSVSVGRGKTVRLAA